MSQVSKYPISKDVADRIFDIFLKSLVEIKDKNEADQFISDLLSPIEKIMLSKRLAIAFLLEKGYDYRSIQKVIRVSAPTITSVNMALKFGSEGFKKLINKIMSEEKIKDFFEMTIEKLISIPASSTKGGGVWRYLKTELDNQKKKNKKAF